MKNKMKVNNLPKDFKGTLKKLLSYMNDYKIGLIIVIIFAILSTIFAIVGPKILGNATTEIFNGLISKINGGSGIDFDKIAKILLFLIFLYILSTLFSYIQGFIMTYITQKTTYKMRRDISIKINKLPLSYFDKKSHGEVLSIITNDVDTVSQSLNQGVTQIITSIVSIIGILAMMFSINVTLSIISFLVLPLSMIIILKIVRKSQKYFRKNQDYLGHLNAKVEEMYTGHNVIKAFNAEKKMLENFESDNEQLYNCAWKSQFLSGLMHPIMNFMSNLSYVLVAIIGGYLAVKGKITVGNIQSFIQYNKNFTMPISQLAQVSNVLQSLIAASERIFEFLNEQEEPIATKSVDVKNIKGNVEFKNAKFGYNDNDTVIKNFNLKVKAGQKIAIVGPTGAGKSTLVKLLMRFYNVNSGEILIDGKNIKELKRENLRHIFGMVLQDTWLFNDTIMENIRYGNLAKSDDEVIEAAKEAKVHHYIQAQSDAYNMIINEETSNISEGQKQLLTIARAILADPKVLILDEATSNVDTRTELQIQESFNRLTRGRTSFIIAHRLSTIKNADVILVMNNGDIVEQGTHKKLLKQNGFYAKLYNSQFENN